MTDLAKAAQARAAASVQPGDRPSHRSAPNGGTGATVQVIRSVELLRSASGTSISGKVGGYASVTESPYQMRDEFGPYQEIVTAGAFAGTLAANPLVEFTVNHGAGGGLPMAHTRNGTLTLGEDETGLLYLATVDPNRSDVADLLAALARGDMAEASFKFRIESGQWSPDYSEFRINAVDLDRGDVSAVNFGANPAATSEVRALADIAARALDAPDVNMMTQVLGWLSSIDMIVDEAQETLAAYLQVPNPDSEDSTEDMQANSAPVQPRLRALRAAIGA